MRFEELESVFVETKSGMLHCLKNKNDSEDISLVLLHGLGADARSWKKLVPFIPEHIGTIIVDLLGHGSSDAPAIDYTPELEAECVAELIGSLNLKDFVLVGNSYGGWVAAYGCANNIFPERLRVLVLEDSAGLKKEIDAILEKMTYDEFYDMELRGALRLNNNKDYVIRSIISNASEKYLLKDEDLKSIKAKTLIVWGKDDDIISSRYAEVFSNCIKDSKVELIDNAGHIPHFSKPEEFAKLLVDFIRRYR